MPQNHEWQTRIKAIEREDLATRQAIDRFQESARRDPTYMRGDLRCREIVRAAAHLEGTSIIRLFAEFETGLRQYWHQARGTDPGARGLLERLAAMLGIPDEQQNNAHRVREYRNSLVHEREEITNEISIGEARHHLAHFFSLLPPKW